MSPHTAVLACTSALCLAMIAEEPEELPTIDGPEAGTLVRELQGSLVHPSPPGGLVALDLPSLEKRSLRPPGKHPGIRDLGGPDRRGTVALVEAGARKESMLRLVRTDGAKGQELLRRPDAGSGSRAVGRPALSPDGEHVAFVSRTVASRLAAEPRTAFHEGTLEVWQTATPQALPSLDVKALDRSLAWLPGSKSLLCCRLVDAAACPGLLEDYGKATGASPGAVPLVDGRMAVVHRLELSTWKSTPLCVGRRIVASSSGKAALVHGMGGEWLLLDLAAARLRAVKLPGLYDRDPLGAEEGGVLALPGEDLAIYWALPTTGAAAGETRSNSPLPGPRRLPCLKVARLSTGEFQTLLPWRDPREVVGYGARGDP